MANRKQFIGKLEIDADLLALLEKPKDHVVTNEELKEQRISFAFGNSPDSDHITKDSVRKSSGALRIAS